MSYGIMPRRGEQEIALNPSLASKFDKNIQNLIGKTAEITWNGHTYSLSVSGIFNAMYDDYYISSDLEQEMYEGISKEVYSVSYDVADFEEIVNVSESLRNEKIESQNASAEVGAFLNTFNNLKRLFFTISALIFAIGVFISAILLVKQQNTRYREVGLLLALGYTKEQVRKILLYENAGLAAPSALSSVIWQVLVAAISRIVRFSFVFTPPQILWTLVMTAVLILFIGFAASIRLMNTEPAKALR